MVKSRRALGRDGQQLGERLQGWTRITTLGADRHAPACTMRPRSHRIRYPCHDITTEEYARIAFSIEFL